MCLSCGLGFAERMMPFQNVFGDGYTLYAHAAGSFEQQRQHLYAEWLSDLIGPPPQRLFEAGCGNGSLLLELTRYLPDTLFCGIEPSPAAAACARGAGLNVRTEFLRSGVKAAEGADLCLAVNVIEHTPDPSAFLRDLTARLPAGGRAIVVCPDGGRPSSELLMADHFYSFTAQSFAVFAASADLNITARHQAPPALGAFHAFVLRLANGPATAICSPAVSVQGDAIKSLMADRTAYLTAWANLDRALARRCGDVTELICFGAGEAANLLRTYAPVVWSRLSRCVIDGGPGGAWGELSVYDAAEIPLSSPGWAVILAVRPEAQPALAERLIRQGARVIRWDDLVMLPAVPPTIGRAANDREAS